MYINIATSDEDATRKKVAHKEAHRKFFEL
jgi:hypothetical protein